MRKALFAVVLVSASFAGGAVVNGPGLRWAQTMILSRMGIDDEKADDGDLSAASSPTGQGAPTAPEEIPARPIPPLVVEPPFSGPGKDKEAPAPVAKAAPPVAAPVPDASPSRSSPAPVSTASVLPGLAPVPEAEAPSLEPPAPLPAPRAGEPAALALASPAPNPAVTPPDKDKVKDAESAPSRDAAVRRVSLTGSAAGDDAVAPASAPAPSPAASGTGSEPGDWAGVRNALRALGVSRYGIEGEPAGRVRFHCLIPLAGRRAVGQHFEAEGDDELEAARAALKRVALWKAAGAAADVP